MDGRWILHVCKDCGQRAHYQERCQKDRRRVWTEQVEVPVVPCDDAAVERVAQVLCSQRGYDWDVAGEGLKTALTAAAVQALVAAAALPAPSNETEAA